MNSRTLNVAALFVLPALSLFGQTGQIGGPVVGFVYDGSVLALRPVLGIPGASTMGDPMDAGFALSSATVAPRQDSAIAMASDGSLHLLRLGSGVTEVRCAACPSSADAAVFSPSGTALALYAAGRVQIVTGLPDAPAAGASFQVGSMGPRSAASGRALPPPMALSDDGVWLLASNRVAVELFSANGGSRRLVESGPHTLVAFAPGSHDAAIAGASLVLVRDVAGAATQQNLVTPGDWQGVRGVAFSSDGGKVFVASADGQSVASVDVSSGAGTVATCTCTPSGLTAMGKVLRLNEAGDGPLWLLDTTASRVVFVPAVVAQ